MGFLKSAGGILGIDYDNQSIKVIELEDAGGRVKLVTYGFLDLELDGKNNHENNKEYTAELIKTVCKKAKTKSKKVISALPGYEVFSSIITLPMYDSKALSAAVLAEAKKLTPKPVEEMILDWRVISSKKDFLKSKKPVSLKAEDGKDDKEKEKILKITKGRAENQKILLTAVSKKLVEEKKEVFKMAGLQLLNIESDSFALIRSLVGRDKAVIMIVDISSTVTNVLIVSAGIPVLTRTMNFGGLTITKALAKNLNISLNRAEQFKYDIGVGREEKSDARVPQMIMELIKPLLQEVKYTYNLYSDNNQQPIEKVILTGGSSLLINLPQQLAAELSSKVYLGNPWARVVYNEDLESVIEEIGPRFATVIGLGMGMFKQKDQDFSVLKMNYLKKITKEKAKTE